MSKLIAILPAADYLYVARFSSNEETRLYLNGVFVDVVNKRLVATDSRRMGLLAMGDDEMHAAPDAASFILTNSKDLQRACKAGRHERLWLRCYDDKLEIVAGGAGSTVEDVQPNTDTPRLVSTLPAANVYVGDTFPDYMCVIPTECSGQAFEKINGTTHSYGFNATYVATFVGPEKNQSVISLLPNGGQAALVLNADPRFLGVLMPTRGGHSPNEAAERAAAIRVVKSADLQGAA